MITMYDLVEHLADPVGDLCAVHRLLKPGGVLFVLTPNDEALVRRISKALFHLSLGRFDRPMRKLYYPDHLSYFTARSLTELFARTGFESSRGTPRIKSLAGSRSRGWRRRSCAACSCSATGCRALGESTSPTLENSLRRLEVPRRSGLC